MPYEMVIKLLVCVKRHLYLSSAYIIRNYSFNLLYHDHVKKSCSYSIGCFDYFRWLDDHYGNTFCWLWDNL